jgi:GT2 family glycosyltransferase
MMHIVISIINFNGKDNTLACLDSLNKLVIDGFTITVVLIDNNSPEPFSLEARKYTRFKLHMVHNERNLGFAGGHNIGIRFAKEQAADYIVILNNDTILDKNLILELVRAMDANEKIAVASPKIYFSPGTEFHKERYQKKDLGKVIWYAGGKMDWKNVIGSHVGVDEVDRGQFDRVEKTAFATGCCMIIRMSAIARSGPFDTRYFLYYEDSDLQERIKALGYVVYYVPQGVLWHRNAASSGGSGSPLQDYYISRNRLLFGYLYAPIRTKLALLKEGIVLMIRGRDWQKRGIIDFYLGKFGKGSYQPGA